MYKGLLRLLLQYISYQKGNIISQECLSQTAQQNCSTIPEVFLSPFLQPAWLYQWHTPNNPKKKKN